MMLLHSTHSTHWPIRTWSHWELWKNNILELTKVIDLNVLIIYLFRVKIEQNDITHTRSVSTRANGVHHCVDVFT